MINRIPRICCAIVIAIASASLAAAHGPQLQISNQNGKIVTHQVIQEGPYAEMTNPKSLYVIPVREFNGGWYARPNNTQRPAPIGGPQYYSGPGLAYGSQAGTADAFLEGEGLSLEFEAGLQVWDGAAFVGSIDHTVRAFRGISDAAAEAFTSATAPFESLAFPQVKEGLEAHTTARFQLLGGSKPANGLYLLSMSVSTSQPGVADSNLFQFLLNKNATAELPSALAALSFPTSLVQVVPEPASALILLLVSVWLPRLRR